MAGFRNQEFSLEEFVGRNIVRSLRTFKATGFAVVFYGFPCRILFFLVKF